MNILEIASKTDCGLIIDGENICIEIGNCLYAINYELSHFTQAVIASYKASLVPVAHIDITKRKVILDDTFVFKTPTIAVIDDIQLYALGETE